MTGGVATGIAGAADVSTGVADTLGGWSGKMKDWWQHNSETSFPCLGPKQLVSRMSTEKKLNFYYSNIITA